MTLKDQGLKDRAGGSCLELFIMEVIVVSIMSFLHKPLLDFGHVIFRTAEVDTKDMILHQSCLQLEVVFGDGRDLVIDEVVCRYNDRTGR